MLCARPPPSTAQLSMQSAVMPFWVRNEDRPSGREKGPEKSMRTRREALGAPCFGIWRRWGEANAASAETEEGAAKGADMQRFGVGGHVASLTLADGAGATFEAK
eukprot:16513-Pleurochrysis_carterae.AAC.1